MPVPFVNRDDLSDYLGRDVSTDDGALIAVDAACDMVRTVAEQQFNKGTTTATYDGTGTDCLLLPERPVSSAGTVLVNGSAITDYVLADNGKLIRRGTLPSSPWVDTDSVVAPLRWPEGRQNVTVTYEHGYDPDDLPRDVRVVALSIAARLIVQGVATEETVGDVRVRYAGAATDLTNGEKMILSKYRQIR